MLDWLLESEKFVIRGLSGTSAGAMNAVVLADGLHKGNEEGAREALAQFWKAVSRGAWFSPVRRSPLDIALGKWSLDLSPGFLMMDLATHFSSPYDFNPLNFNPLREIVEASVDFEAVRPATISRFSSPPQM